VRTPITTVALDVVLDDPAPLAAVPFTVSALPVGPAVSGVTVRVVGAELPAVSAPVTASLGEVEPGVHEKVFETYGGPDVTELDVKLQLPAEPESAA
jgi:hypothetical protein